MHNLISAFLVASIFLGSPLLRTPKIKASDFQRVTGAQWVGTLTYLDYRSNKKVSIASTLTVTQSAEDKWSWDFDYHYPDEPKANNKDRVAVTREGTIVDGENVVSRTRLPGDTLKIVTEKHGPDNDKPALFRFTYLLSSRSFSIRKEVRYEGTTDFIERNQYSWTR